MPQKRSIFNKEYAPYGTYEGARGNSSQWRDFYKQTMSPEEIKAALGNDSPYAILGVSSTATQQEIKKAFRKLIAIHHPDKGGDNATARKIIAAYEKLKED